MRPGRAWPVRAVRDGGRGARGGRSAAHPGKADSCHLDALSGALGKVIRGDEFREKMEKLTYAPLYMDPQTKQWVAWSKAREK